LWFVGSRVLTLSTPIGRKVRPSSSAGTPLARVKLGDLAAAGVERVPRTSRVRDGTPVLEDGRATAGSNVV
jgi:putative flavoprotein involved in K+ transport